LASFSTKKIPPRIGYGSPKFALISAGTKDKWTSSEIEKGTADPQRRRGSLTKENSQYEKLNKKRESIKKTETLIQICNFIEDIMKSFISSSKYTRSKEKFLLKELKKSFIE
jgi:hypothetical protein